MAILERVAPVEVLTRRGSNVYVDGPQSAVTLLMTWGMITENLTQHAQLKSFMVENHNCLVCPYILEHCDHVTRTPSLPAAVAIF